MTRTFLSVSPLFGALLALVSGCTGPVETPAAAGPSGPAAVQRKQQALVTASWPVEFAAAAIPANTSTGFSNTYGVRLAPDGSLYTAFSASGDAVTVGGTTVNRIGTQPNSVFVVVAKFDPTGQLVWAVPLLGGAPQVGELFMTPSGDVAFFMGINMGSVEMPSLGQTFALNGAPAVAAVGVFSASTGALQWAQRVETTYEQGWSSVGGMGVEPSGNLAFADTTGVIHRFQPDGTPLGTVPAPASFTGYWRFAVDSAGNYVHAGDVVGAHPALGTTGGLSGTRREMFVTQRAAADGSVTWSKALGSEDDGASCAQPPCDAVRAIALATGLNGKVFVSGSFETGTLLNGALTKGPVQGDDTFVAAFDSAGQLLWAKGYGDSNGIYSPNSLVADAAGRLFVWGFRFGAIPSLLLPPLGQGYDGVLAVYDAAGTLKHVEVVGGPTAYAYVYVGRTVDFRAGRVVLCSAAMMGDFTQPVVSREGAFQVGMVASYFANDRPEITCPADVVTSSTTTTASATWADATAIDPDGATTPTITYDQVKGSDFPLGATTVTATATDEANVTATCTFTVTVNDTAAPVLTCPADVTVEATGPDGALATFADATYTDNSGNAQVAASPVSGGTYALGNTTVTFTGTDAAQNQGTCSLKVTVQDTTKPSVSCPQDVTLEATGPNGYVNVELQAPATATDIVTAEPVITYAPKLDGGFPVGSNTVTTTARDTAGNTESCTFNVVVTDTTAPVLTLPETQVVEATGPSGAPATFSPTAEDLVSLQTTVTCSPASGTTYALGDTTVSCESKDAKDNAATGTFTVRVVDTTGPAITVPADQTVEATGPNGAVATFADATAEDLVSGATVTTCDRLSGETFALGDNVVTCTSKDERDNSSSKPFTVSIVDTTNPSFAVPPDRTVEAIDFNGAPATWADILAQDIVDGDIVATCAPVPGSLFPLGENVVVCRATDAHFNSAGTTFKVNVVDTTPPVLGCPQVPVTEALSISGAPVAFNVTVADPVSTPSLALSHQSGMSFPLGSTRVTANARDAAGNASSCSFDVVVADTVAPDLSCPADVTVEAENGQGKVVSWDAPVATDVASLVTVESNPPAGSVFPLGESTVTVTASDVAGNTSTCSFKVKVQDTTPPALTCPEDMVVEAMGGEGTLVGFAVTTRDAVSEPTVATDKVSDTVFPLGTTQVAVTSTDAAGNASSCSFQVKVQDTVAPVISCPPPVRTVVFPENEVAALRWDEATAEDTVSTPVITYDRENGIDVPFGDTTVKATATDAAGNASSCTFTVTKERVGLSGGFGCSSAAASPADASLLALALSALWRRRRKLSALVLAGVSALPGLARAEPAGSLQLQDFSAERFRSTLDADGIIAVESATTQPKGTVTANLWASYAHNPVALYAGKELVGVPVGRRVGMGLTASYAVVDWFQAGVELPAVLFQAQGRWPNEGLVAPIAPSAANGLGDLRLVPKFSLLKESSSFVNVAVVPGFTLPTGGSVAYRGEPGVTFQPEALVSRSFGGLRLGGSVIVPLRASPVNGALYGSELGLGLGAALRLGKWEAALSGNATAALARPFQRSGETTAEGRAQVAYALPLGLTARVGVGAGTGWSTPDYRVFAGLLWQQVPEAPKPVEVPVVAEAPKFVDSDGDGVLEQDRCPAEAEDKDGFEDEDGCLDPDDDKDGVLDVADRCVRVPGVAENAGCPDPDTDGDGLVDRLDACVNEPGPRELQGCKPPALAEVKGDVIDLKEAVYFASDKDVIEPVSYAVLDAAAEVLKAHPEFTRVLVEGHTDSSGRAARNKVLSAKRAAAVVQYLVGKGLDAARLSSKGFGQEQPVADNATPEGRAKNRRVVLRVEK